MFHNSEVRAEQRSRRRGLFGAIPRELHERAKLLSEASGWSLNLVLEMMLMEGLRLVAPTLTKSSPIPCVDRKDDLTRFEIRTTSQVADMVTTLSCEYHIPRTVIIRDALVAGFPAAKENLGSAIQGLQHRREEALASLGLK